VQGGDERKKWEMGEEEQTGDLLAFYLSLLRRFLVA
jgi:hypothetical protein